MLLNRIKGRIAFFDFWLDNFPEAERNCDKFKGLNNIVIYKKLQFMDRLYNFVNNVDRIYSLFIIFFIQLYNVVICISKHNNYYSRI